MVSLPFTPGNGSALVPRRHYVASSSQKNLTVARAPDVLLRVVIKHQSVLTLTQQGVTVRFLVVCSWVGPSQALSAQRAGWRTTWTHNGPT